MKDFISDYNNEITLNTHLGVAEHTSLKQRLTVI